MFVNNAIEYYGLSRWTEKDMSFRRFNLLLMTLMIAACSVFFAAAKDEPFLKIYNTRIVTNDVNATYIEGEIASSEGQQIIVLDGIRTVASRTMPVTGRTAKFRVRIPADSIEKDRMSVLHVKAVGRDGSSVAASDRIEVEYKEREKQQISVEDDSYEMTIPSLDKKIKAEASSGEDLIYTSSDPEVAVVDEDGEIIPKGEGTAEISIQQIGTSQYDRAEESVKVSVEEIDAYSVTFHSSDDENKTTKQIIPRDSTEELEACSFENGDHKFLGWATEDNGLREFVDADEVKDLADKGENVDLYAVWTGDGAPAAVAWAIDIANDDSFAYGKKPAANAIGCYFCGTNCGPVKYNKPKGYEKTYVCLTFVAAAYAHGAEDPEVYYACSHGKMPLYENNNNFSKFSCWTKLGSCSSLSIDDLEPGDVVIQWSAHNDNSGHTWMYAGGDKIVESTGGGWGAGSIALKGGASARLRSYGRNGRNYVMRYTGENALN